MYCPVDVNDPSNLKPLNKTLSDRYVFKICSLGNSTPSFDQVTTGLGTPLAVQVNVTLVLNRICVTFEIDMIDGGTKITIIRIINDKIITITWLLLNCNKKKVLLKYTYLVH